MIRAFYFLRGSSAISAIRYPFPKTFLYAYIGFPKKGHLNALIALFKKQPIIQSATLTLVGPSRRFVR